MTVEEFRLYRQKKDQEEAAAKNSKYKNKKVIIDGFKFDSQKEAAFYGQCKILKLSGKIKNIELQKRFYFTHNGVKIGFYKADFVLTLPDDSLQVIDVKSDFTRKLPRYRKQKKLMLAFHNIKIIEK